MVRTAVSLKGKTIVVTRPRNQAAKVGKLIEKLGGIPYYFPTIEVKASRDLASIQSFICELVEGTVDYVVFMSVNGVKFLFDAAKQLGQLSDLIDGLANTSVVAVGSETEQALKNSSIKVDIVPELFTSEGVVQSLLRCGVAGKVIRIPRTTAASNIIVKRLQDAGADVKDVYVYTSTLPADTAVVAKFIDDLITKRVSAVVFGSSLCVRNLFQMLSAQISESHLQRLLNNNVTIVAIGPVTARTLAEMGVKVDVMPDKPLFDDAIKALARYWSCG
ncbi:MAG: uroporphyrinogen-III synthase [Candidatus Bathyarchaeia archaeon]